MTHGISPDYMCVWKRLAHWSITRIRTRTTLEWEWGCGRVHWGGQMWDGGGGMMDAGRLPRTDDTVCQRGGTLLCNRPVRWKAIMTAASLQKG